jgi:hypothetical protein
MLHGVLKIWSHSSLVTPGAHSSNCGITWTLHHSRVSPLRGRANKQRNHVKVWEPFFIIITWGMYSGATQLLFLAKCSIIQLVSANTLMPQKYSKSIRLKLKFKNLQALTYHLLRLFISSLIPLHDLIYNTTTIALTIAATNTLHRYLSSRFTDTKLSTKMLMIYHKHFQFLCDWVISTWYCNANDDAFIKHLKSLLQIRLSSTTLHKVLDSYIPHCAAWSARKTFCMCSFPSNLNIKVCSLGSNSVSQPKFLDLYSRSSSSCNIHIYYSAKDILTLMCNVWRTEGYSCSTTNKLWPSMKQKQIVPEWN